MANERKTDELNADERKIIAVALELQRKSLERAIRSAKSAAIATAFDAERIQVAALEAKFR